MSPISNFAPHQLPFQSRPSWNVKLAALDQKVSDVALKSISYISFGLSSIVAITASVLIGVGSIPLLFIGGSLCVGALASFIRSQMMRYFDPNQLKLYKEQAQEHLHVYEEFAKQIASLDEETQEKFLRPISVLLETHTIEAVLSYELLSEEDLKKAFLMELKYKNTFDKIAFLSKFAKHPACAVLIHKDRLKDELCQCFSQIKQKASNGFSSYNQFYEWDVEITQFLEYFTLGAESSVIAVDLREAKRFEERIKACIRQIHEHQRDGALYHKKIRDRSKADMDHKMPYLGSELHEFIEKRQRAYLQSIMLIIRQKMRDDQKLEKEINPHLTDELRRQQNALMQAPRDDVNQKFQDQLKKLQASFFDDEYQKKNSALKELFESSSPSTVPLEALPFGQNLRDLLEALNASPLLVVEDEGDVYLDALENPES